ncbi:hypothetical protein NA57DRAFT_77249 [Rhizodiscina lignyota]|uniref:Metallo-beta-lactamase domain-containing protein n=1 Tax=Rhizodiscina lignyota TaxID=1504668 RepID=A0A9P4M8N5_9PEZI|nr:hypothetical protein NA57DRAFT_77249 [Rhizodiscina lignyota]
MPDLSHLIYIPQPTDQDACVSIKAFETGRMQYPHETVVEARGDALKTTSWRFFISHGPSNTKLWFDMGLATTVDVYPPIVQEVAERLYKFEPAPNTPLDDMEKIREDPKSVKYVIASHAHWDHMFPVGQHFPQAKMLCGPGTLELTSQSFPKFESSPYDGRIWDATMSDLPLWDLPSPANYPSKWQRLGPFANAHDFFGDGSFWIIDAPGHVAGNLAVLCSARTKTGDRRWILLAADCMHSNDFLDDPELPFGYVTSREGFDINAVDERGTMHVEPEKARAIIRQIAEFKRENPTSVVWLGHSEELETREDF